MLKAPLIIECKWMSGAQTQLEELGICEVKTGETADKQLRFCHIDHYYEFEDSTDGKTRVAIHSGQNQFVTDMPISKLDELIADFS